MLFILYNSGYLIDLVKIYRNTSPIPSINNLSSIVHRMKVLAANKAFTLIAEWIEDAEYLRSPGYTFHVIHFVSIQGCLPIHLHNLCPGGETSNLSTVFQHLSCSKGTIFYGRLLKERLSAGYRCHKAQKQYKGNSWCEFSDAAHELFPILVATSLIYENKPAI